MPHAGARTEWHILSGEYLPALGGVAAYTSAVADRLAAAGDDVHVWVPQADARGDGGVHIHVLPDHFGPQSLRILEAGLAQAGSSARLLVQYVPHAFGSRAMNVRFCAWLARRRRIPLWVMFHEVAYPIEPGQPLRHTVLAIVNRVMAWLATRSAERVFVSTEGWVPLVRRLAPRRVEVEVLPIFANVPVVGDRAQSDAVRSRIAPAGSIVVGHFGSFGSLITDILHPSITLILRQATRTVALLIGSGSDRFARELLEANPDLEGRVHATGTLDPSAISTHIDACDFLVQPYPGGVCTRRSSATALLAHGASVVTTTGVHTEPLWRTANVVVLAEENASSIAAAAQRLIASAPDRDVMSRNARQLYREVFEIDRTIHALREGERSFRAGGPPPQ